MTESGDGKRYRLLAEKACQMAQRAMDANIKAAYEDIAQQYETLAITADRLAKKEKWAP